MWNNVFPITNIFPDNSVPFYRSLNVDSIKKKLFGYKISMTSLSDDREAVCWRGVSKLRLVRHYQDNMSAKYARNVISESHHNNETNFASLKNFIIVIFRQEVGGDLLKESVYYIFQHLFQLSRYSQAMLSISFPIKP